MSEIEIDIGDFVMINDEVRFVTGVVSDPILQVFYYIGNTEYIALGCDIDCHFLNMNRYSEKLKEQGNLNE